MKTTMWMAGLCVLIAAVGLASAEEGDVPKTDVGATAPGFRLNDQHGKAVSLAEQAKDAWAIVAFYPKSLTPG